MGVASGLPVWLVASIAAPYVHRLLCRSEHAHHAALHAALQFPAFHNHRSVQLTLRVNATNRQVSNVLITIRRKHAQCVIILITTVAQTIIISSATSGYPT